MDATTAAKAQKIDQLSSDQQLVVFTAALSLEESASAAATPLLLFLPPPRRLLPGRSFLHRFETGCVDVIFFHLTSFELSKCCIISKCMTIEMERISKELCKCILLQYYRLCRDQMFSEMKKHASSSYILFLRELTRQRILVLGGFQSLRQVDILDLFGANRVCWQSCAPMQLDRHHFSITITPRRSEVIVVGSNAAAAIGSIERFNFVTQQWTSLCSLPLPLCRSTCAIMYRSIMVHLLIVSGGYFFDEIDGGGGDDDDDGAQPTISDRVYSLKLKEEGGPAAAGSSTGTRSAAAEDEWQMLEARLITPRFAAASVTIDNGTKLIVAGGQNGKILRSCEMYDSLSSSSSSGGGGKKFVSLPDMQRMRHSFDLIVIDNQVYAAGGAYFFNTTTYVHAVFEQEPTFSIEKLVREGNDWRWEIIAEQSDPALSESSTFRTIACQNKICLVGQAVIAAFDVVSLTWQHMESTSLSTTTPAAPAILQNANDDDDEESAVNLDDGGGADDVHVAATTEVDVVVGVGVGVGVGAAGGGGGVEAADDNTAAAGGLEGVTMPAVPVDSNRLLPRDMFVWGQAIAIPFHSKVVWRWP